jgi:general secretion pathway protein E
MPDARLLQPASVEFEEFLLERGALDGSAYERAARLQAESGEALSAILTKLGLVPELALAEAYAAYLELPIVAAGDFPETAILSDRLSSQFLRRTRIIPVSDTAQSVVVAMADPLDDESAEALQFALGKAVVRRVALPSDIEAAYERLYGDRSAGPA